MHFKKSLRFKILAFIFSGSLILSLLIMFYFIPLIENFFIEQKKNEIKTAAEVMLSNLDHINKSVVAKKITKDEAVIIAKELFSTSRYNKNDYFFAYDFNGVVVAHGMKPEMIGLNRMNDKDPDGKFYIKEFHSLFEKKLNGFVSYKFEKVKGGTLENKISYLALFEPFGWQIGTGVYLTEIETIVNSIRRQILSAAFLLLGIVMIAAIYLSTKLNKSLTLISEHLLSESEDVLNTSIRLTSISEVLTSSSQEQAAAVQETASSLTETSAMIDRNATNAFKSLDVSKDSHDYVTKGKNKVNEMIDSIGEIKKANHEIQDQVGQNSNEMQNIISMISDINAKTNIINDIVFQLKLLSFNASVEAARAGENGKGFAVVAEEIGTLAKMSGESAQEISKLLIQSTEKVSQIIRDSSNKMNSIIKVGQLKVDQGELVSKDCFEIFNSIVKNSDEIINYVDEIAQATKEQSSGVREISTAVSELDLVAQKNSSISTETLTIADNLKKQVSDLKQMTHELEKVIHG
jgi:methyl-accepting chemotaxis protein